MEVLLAEYSGFCFGVKRAVELVEKALSRNKKNKIYSIGPFIHNPQMVKQLSRKGLKVAGNLKDIKNGCIIIRSHGVRPSLIKEAKRKKIKVVNVTCPYVVKAQNISKNLKAEGYTVIIVGDKKHPEVQALKGFADDKAIVLNAASGIKKLNLNGQKIGVIAQTTQSREKYFKVVSNLLSKKGFKEIRVFDTICADTIRRQNSALKLAERADVMFVLGGKKSANTKRLTEICKSLGTTTYHIEEAKEIKTSALKNKKRIGITSGASTPDWIIDQVKDRISKI